MISLIQLLFCPWKGDVSSVPLGFRRGYENQYHVSPHKLQEKAPADARSLIIVAVVVALFAAVDMFILGYCGVSPADPRFQYPSVGWRWSVAVFSLVCGCSFYALLYFLPGSSSIARLRHFWDSYELAREVLDTRLNYLSEIGSSEHYYPDHVRQFVLDVIKKKIADARDDEVDPDGCIAAAINVIDGWQAALEPFCMSPDFNPRFDGTLQIAS